MSGRRRTSAVATLAIAIAVVAVACGSADEQTGPPDPTEMSVRSVAGVTTTPGPTGAAAPTTRVSSTTTTSATTTPATTTSGSTSATSTSVVCESLDVVVLGNSTDYWPNYVSGRDAPTDDAWPAVLEVMLRDELPDTRVRVDNESVLGAGFDIGLYGVTSMSDQLESLAASSRGGSSLLLLAPSVVDLQLRSLDVDASFTAFVELNRRAISTFDSVHVLPMNPVAVGFDAEVARAVDDFNRRLVDAGLIDDDDASPLLLGDGPFGRPEFYDDFDDGRLDTPGPDPDGLHPDADGHLALAAAVTAQITSMTPAVCT